MADQSSQIFESYVPVYDAVPEKWEDAREFLAEQFKKISEAVNVREIGWFLDEELLSGKQFIPGTNNPQEFRTILRKVVDCGPLPNNGTKTIPHGITVDSNFTLTGLYGVATDSVGLTSFSFPFATIVANAVVQLYIDSTNIQISDLVNYSNYTRVFVFIEYTQEL